MDLWLFSGMKLRTKFDTILFSAEMKNGRSSNKVIMINFFIYIMFQDTYN